MLNRRDFLSGTSGGLAASTVSAHRADAGCRRLPAFRCSINTNYSFSGVDQGERISNPMFRLGRLLPVSVTLVVLMTPIAKTAVTESNVQRTNADRVEVTWTATGPVDVYLTNRPNRNIAAAKRLVAADNEGRLTAVVREDHRTYFVLRDRVDGDVAMVSERLLPLQRGSNFRDVGGYKTLDGRHVRWGLIYRSGATPLLSARDVSYIRGLGLHAMIDLRGNEERELAPTRVARQGINYIAIDYSLNDLALDYESILVALNPQYRSIFRELLLDQGPVSYNCTAGQDRTGIATALILSALGVPRATILEDYQLSTMVRHPENEMPPVDPAKYPHNSFVPVFAKGRLMKPTPLYSADGRPLLAELFAKIDTRWGSVENYLRDELGVGPAELARLRSDYLE